MARTILVIDDSSIIRTLVRLALEPEGCAIVEAVDGEDAIDKLDGRDLQAIVCDLAMPRMDGLMFLKYLRLHPRYGKTPVVILSTESRPERRMAARSCGAQAFINKPCTPRQLVAALEQLCPAT